MCFLFLLLLLRRKIFVSLLIRRTIPHIVGKYLYLDYFAAKLVTNRKGSLSKFRTASCLHQKPMMKKKSISRRTPHLFGKDLYRIYVAENLSNIQKRFVSLLLLRKILHLVRKDSNLYYST